MSPSKGVNNKCMGKSESFRFLFYLGHYADSVLSWTKTHLLIYQKDQTSGICVILLTKKNIETKGKRGKQMFLNSIPAWRIEENNL